MNYKNKIEEIRNEKEFLCMYQYVKGENLLNYINKFSLGSLNEIKLNFFFNCMSWRENETTYSYFKAL